MDLNPYITTLRENLTAALSLQQDERTQAAAPVLAATIEPAARLAIMNALSDLAAEVTLALEDRVVQVRLDGQDVQIAVSGAAAPPEDEHEPGPPPPPPVDGGDISRITVRLFEELKGKAEEAAAAQGMSLNAFVQQAVQGALTGPGPGRRRGGPWGSWPGGPGDWSGRRGDWSGGRGSSRVRGWVQG